MKINNNKNKGGRPLLKENEKKDALVKIYCRISEKEAIVKAARSAGLTVSDYAKKRMLGEKVVLNYGDIFKELHVIGTEFSRAGNNINQLARHANSLNKVGKLDKSIADSFNLLLSDYVKKNEEIRIVLRKLTRELTK